MKKLYLFFFILASNLFGDDIYVETVFKYQQYKFVFAYVEEESHGFYLEESDIYSEDERHFRIAYTRIFVEKNNEIIAFSPFYLTPVENVQNSSELKINNRYMCYRTDVYNAGFGKVMFYSFENNVFNEFILPYGAWHLFDYYLYKNRLYLLTGKSGFIIRIDPDNNEIFSFNNPSDYYWRIFYFNNHLYVIKSYYFCRSLESYKNLHFKLYLIENNRFIEVKDKSIINHALNNENIYQNSQIDFDKSLYEDKIRKYYFQSE